ncbi:MAG TPA: PIN domain-containing protein [Candidatus Acidoferrum sp.]|nr:PIN domain-containing protein [Candidatus Acidoferrum sp.]
MSKKRVNLFIDTNIFLGFYYYSGDDLGKLDQLEDLIIKTKDINLLVTHQQVDEFYRNRDGMIAKVVRELSIPSQIPELFSGHTEFAAVKKQAGELKSKLEQIKQQTLAEAKAGNLKADQIIGRLFRDPLLVTEEIYTLAKKRAKVGNPPGKSGSLGDAINWELLLASVSAGEGLHIVSRDGDFGSALDKTRLDSFLQREWGKNSFAEEIQLHQTLNGFFKAKFPQIRLMDEYIKDDLIRQLAESPSFNDSRRIIEKMSNAGSFSERQIGSIYKAATTNNQVYGAHQYSPELIGDKLWQVIKPLWPNFSNAEQNEWVAIFADDRDLEMPDEISF